MSFEALELFSFGYPGIFGFKSEYIVNFLGPFSKCRKAYSLRFFNLHHYKLLLYQSVKKKLSSFILFKKS